LPDDLRAEAVDPLLEVCLGGGRRTLGARDARERLREAGVRGGERGIVARVVRIGREIANERPLGEEDLLALERRRVEQPAAARGVGVLAEVEARVDGAHDAVHRVVDDRPRLLRRGRRLRAVRARGERRPFRAEPAAFEAGRGTGECGVARRDVLVDVPPAPDLERAPAVVRDALLLRADARVRRIGARVDGRGDRQGEDRSEGEQAARATHHLEGPPGKTFDAGISPRSAGGQALDGSFGRRSDASTACDVLLAGGATRYSVCRVRRLALALVPAVLAATASAADVRFLREGAVVKTVDVGTLARECGLRTVEVDDPNYGARKRYRACPLAAVFRIGLGTPPEALGAADVFIRAWDGYDKPTSAATLAEPGAWVAFGDAEAAGGDGFRFAPLGPRRVDPGPLYLVWEAGAGAAKGRPWPWQIAEFEVEDFGKKYPHVAPT